MGHHSNTCKVLCMGSLPYLACHGHQTTLPMSHLEGLLKPAFPGFTFRVPVDLDRTQESPSPKFPTNIDSGSLRLLLENVRSKLSIPGGTSL